MCLILIPRFYFQVFYADLADGVDVGARKAGVGDERNVEVDGGATDLVSVFKFPCGVVFGDVDHKVDLMI